MHWLSSRNFFQAKYIVMLIFLLYVFGPDSRGANVSEGGGGAPFPHVDESQMHEADSAYSIRSTWLCYRRVRSLTVAYNGQHTFVLSLVIYIIFPLCTCPFNSMASSGVEADSVAFGQFWNILLLFSGVTFFAILSVSQLMT